jgi:tRNA uridine 5-carbamoylmethylation protein Kti12
MEAHKLIIIRGVSGSGKSTIARHLLNCDRGMIHPDWHEADHFFNDDVENAYKFNYKQLSAAHRWCQATVARSLYFQRPLVVVSNTSIYHKDVMIYMELAYEYGYEWELIKSPGPWDLDTLFKRNEHGVPREVLENQIKRYQPMVSDTEWTNLEIFNNGKI